MPSAKVYHSVDELPVLFDVATFQEVMGFSRSSAYIYIHSEGFPAEKFGKSIRIYKEPFKQWLNEKFNKRNH